MASPDIKGQRKALGHPFGIHRVLDLEPVLPQAAERIDNTLPIYSNEILIKVERLNIDAASFVHMENETEHSEEKIAEIILENCLKRGKQHNRHTGSGGMLVGEVLKVGSQYKGPLKFKKGDRIATLVSLTLTPLNLEKIERVNLKTHQVDVQGHAILFEKSIAALLPKDMPEAVAMAVYDVAGAPATVHALCKLGQTVVVIGGGGKAGLLSCVAARKTVGSKGKIIAIEPGKRSADALRILGVCDAVLEVDATHPIRVLEAVAQATKNKMADLVVNVASVHNTEVSSILSAKPKGKVLFFSMATSFTKVALGAEGIASSAELIFGNGYYPHHAEFSLQLLRKNKGLRQLFEAKYGSSN